MVKLRHRDAPLSSATGGPRPRPPARLTGGIMMTRSAMGRPALLGGAGLAAAGLAAWGGYGVPAGEGVPAHDGGAAAPGTALHCGSVVDSAGYRRGPLTASLAVASLTALPL